MGAVKNHFHDELEHRRAVEDGEAPAFTPGPWRAGVTGNNRVYGPNCAGEHSGLIAVTYKCGGNRDLIAAAPELYDMLEWLVASYDLGVVGTERATALLAKARGDA